MSQLFVSSHRGGGKHFNKHTKERERRKGNKMSAFLLFVKSQMIVKLSLYHMNRHFDLVKLTSSFISSSVNEIYNAFSKEQCHRPVR